MITDEKKIASLLVKDNENIARKDETIFGKWVKRQIDTETCIKNFLENNNAYAEIDNSTFERWLNGLGYYRYK